jgi:DNA-binding NarL/FixJ family response regulator
VSRARKLFPHYKKYLEDLGFKDVEATGEERDSLNMVINELKPRLMLVGSAFYQAATPFRMGQLHKRFPKLNIAAVSLHEFLDSLAAWFIWHGVKSYVNYWEGIEEFYQGLQAVREGKEYISPPVKELINLFPVWPQTYNDTTKRLLGVLVLLCNGFPAESIGAELQLSRKTVYNDMDRLYATFHVRNRDELVAKAWELQLVTEKDMRFFDRRGEPEPLPEWAAVKQKTNRGILQNDYSNEGRGIPGG